MMKKDGWNIIKVLKMSEKVYAFIAWDDDYLEKTIFLCRTEELAKKLRKEYTEREFPDHTLIKELKIHESLDDAVAGGWPDNNWL